MPAKDASVPNLVRRDQIEAANQLSLITTYGLTPVLGAALFSVLSLITNVLARHLTFFQTQPMNLALYFNAATFLVGAIVVFFIPEISGRRAGPPAEDQPSLLRPAARGRQLRPQSRLVGGLIIGLIGAFVAGGAVIGAGKIFAESASAAATRRTACCSARSSSASARAWRSARASRASSRGAGCSACRSCSPRCLPDRSPRSCRRSRSR